MSLFPGKPPAKKHLFHSGRHFFFIIITIVSAGCSLTSRTPLLLLSPRSATILLVRPVLLLLGTTRAATLHSHPHSKVTVMGKMERRTLRFIRRRRCIAYGDRKSDQQHFLLLLRLQISTILFLVWLLLLLYVGFLCDGPQIKEHLCSSV